MTLLCVGLAIWISVHLTKRLAPATRANLDAKLGVGPAKGAIAFMLIVSIVLMVLGYGDADKTPLYPPIAGIGHLNNLLMVLAVLLLGMGSSKGKMRAWLRHPMLWGVVVWGVAHLLVNGDLPSVILFGGMILWALLQMVLINRAVTDWTRPEPGPISGDVRLIVITAVVFTVIVGIHSWLGYNLFAGTYA